MTEEATPGTRPAIAWSWPRALAGVIYAIPTCAVVLFDPPSGIPLAVGVLPATIVPMPGPRPARLMVFLIGSAIGVSMFLGGVLTHLPTVLTALALAAAVVGAALLTVRTPRGILVLTLCVPLMAAGLSYDDYRTSARTALLLIPGSTYAWLVSLLWPARPAADRPPTPTPGRRRMLEYGLRLGAAAGLAYLAASGLDLDHPGWAPAACLLVARPQVDLLKSRGVDRVLAVLIGGTLAVVVLHLSPPAAAYAALAVVLLAGAAATSGSRWYVTPGFASFFVLLMILYGNPAASSQKLNERVGETILGVALAYAFGWLLPLLASQVRPTQ
jgi:hypothetical protein